MGSLTKKWKDNIISLLTLSLLIIGVWLYVHYYNRMPQKYTIGKAIDTWVPSNGDRGLKYEYNIYYKKYENIIRVPGKNFKVGEHYFVRFPEEHYDKGVLMLDKPVPDSINEAPLDGWTLEELQKIYPEFKPE